MNTLTTTEVAAPGSTIPRLTTQLHRVHSAMGHLPNTLLAFIARFSIAAVFWKSGQTKVEGLAIDLVDGTFELGWPRLADSTIPLFQKLLQEPDILSGDYDIHWLENWAKRQKAPA